MENSPPTEKGSLAPEIKPPLSQVRTECRFPQLERKLLPRILTAAFSLGAWDGQSAELTSWPSAAGQQLTSLKGTVPV